MSIANEPNQAKKTPSIDKNELPFGFSELFKIGIGPSSSHTSGPMAAAACFVASLNDDLAKDTQCLSATLFGSLAWTGKGHKAIVLGFAGLVPEIVQSEQANELFRNVCELRKLLVPGIGNIPFS